MPAWSDGQIPVWGFSPASEHAPTRMANVIMFGGYLMITHFFLVWSESNCSDLEVNVANQACRRRNKGDILEEVVVMLHFYPHFVA